VRKTKDPILGLTPMGKTSFEFRIRNRMSMKYMKHGMSRSSVNRSLITLAMFLGLGVAGSALTPATAQENDVAEGRRIWAEKAQCVQCHGWAGDGASSSLHSPGNAPSLRLTQLNRDQIRETIQCGRPGTPMPHFDRFAYTDKRCFGVTADELGTHVPDRGAVTLQSYEIDAVADYIVAKIKGGGPVTRSECLEFFKAGAGSNCDMYPQG
jgi:mono/diheme cytochrome c family protein